jgi:uncharacterized membrane-anchored protein YitT (DUF2179 family)
MPHALHTLKSVVIVVIGALLTAVGFNVFIIHHHLLSGGLSGVSMMIGYFTGSDIGIVFLILNVPVLLWGYVVLGRFFVLLSMLSVVLTSWFMQIIPTNLLEDTDILIGAVFGGVIAGIGMGITLRAGGSTGGVDIIGSILIQKRDIPLGTLLSFLNGAIIVIHGYLTQDWNLALYSLISIYVTGKVVDMIHIRHIKVTAFIITTEKDKLLEKLLKKPRGVTHIKTTGAYSSQEKDMLMTVTTRYELEELKRTIRSVDPHAFVNIVETVEVLGEFRRN